MRAAWCNIVYNAYEPDNIVQFIGELTEENIYKVFEVKAYLNFRDGSSIVSINRDDSGLFHWRKGTETGTALTVEKAWSKMPSLITDPDDYEETQMVYQETK